MKFEEARITGPMFKRNLEAKLEMDIFNQDLRPLLGDSVEYHVNKAAEVVTEKLLNIL
jgi:hypothetical protein